MVFDAEVCSNTVITVIDQGANLLVIVVLKGFNHMIALKTVI